MELPQGLSQRLGPLPVWQWVLLGGMGVAALAYLRRRGTKAAAGPIILQPATAGSGGLSGGGVSGPSPDSSTGATGGYPPGDPRAEPGWSLALQQTRGSVSISPSDGSPQTGGNFAAFGGLPLCTPNLGKLCILGAGHLPGHPDVPFFPSDYTGDWVASYVVGGGPPEWPHSAAEVFSRLGTSRPERLPVADRYGNIGMQTTQAAAAGGYWGASGQWVPTPTPWNVVPGSPPAGPGLPVPYTSTTTAQPIPDTGSIRATPATPRFAGEMMAQLQQPGLYDGSHLDLGALESVGRFVGGGFTV